MVRTPFFTKKNMEKGRLTVVVLHEATGERHLVVCFGGDTVWQLKQKVFFATDVPPPLQALCVVRAKDGRERPLHVNSQKIWREKIRDNASLVLRERPSDDDTAAVAALVPPLRSLSAPQPGHGLQTGSAIRQRNATTAAALLPPPLSSLAPSACFAYGTGLRQALAGHAAEFWVVRSLNMCIFIF